MDLTGTTTATTANLVEERFYRIGPTQMTTSAATLYTVPSKKIFRLEHFTISNASASGVAASVWIVAASGTASNSNALINAIQIPANGVLTWEGPQYLTAATETLQVKASANSALVFFGSGIEQ